MNPAAYAIMSSPHVVVDVGTGQTKAGFAGNGAPQSIFPTVVASRAAQKASALRSGFEDRESYVGHEALERKNIGISNPLRHGIVENWADVERIYQHALYEQLRCDPEMTYFLTTEPPLNPPENREELAEIFFETFNARGLRIDVQAVLALQAIANGNEWVETGTVIDSGDGVTHVIPVVDGYVLSSSIKHVPVAGKDLTRFIVDMWRDRNEPVPPGDIFEEARRFKEKWCYVCPDICKEFQKYELAPETWIKTIESINSVTKQPYKYEIGPERFLAPEVYFQPEIASSDFPTPLSELVFQTIESAPRDARRRLYETVVLSGGSTMFKDFGKRLQRDITRKVDAQLARSDEHYIRLQLQRQKLNDELVRQGGTAIEYAERKVKVNVISHARQSYAVWYGGSRVASSAGFPAACVSKQTYYEEGSQVVRRNVALGHK